jgi:hypothetical protein
LNDYVVLAQTGIIFPSAPQILTNIYYNYGNVGGSSEIVGTPANGFDDNSPGNLANANTNLNQIIIDINGLTGLTNVIYNGSTNQTFYSGYKYTDNIIDISGVTLTFDASGNTGAQFFIISASSITFSNVTFILINGAQSNNIYWLANAGNITYDANTLQGYGRNISTNAIIFEGNTTVNGNIWVAGTSIVFTNGASINPNVVCYLKGSKILTPNGYVSIENLEVGNKVITHGEIYDNAHIKENAIENIETINWIGNFRVPIFNEKTMPICIRAHTFGKNTPFENLWVSPFHRIILDNELVLASDLINGTTIFQDDSILNIDYYHFETDKHSAIVANGILSETYLDYSSRNVFSSSVSNKSIIQTPIDDIQTPIDHIQTSVDDIQLKIDALMNLVFCR